MALASATSLASRPRAAASSSRVASSVPLAQGVLGDDELGAQLLEAAGRTDHPPGVAEVPFQLASHRRHGEGLEAAARTRLVAQDRDDEGGAGDLDEVLGVDAAAGVAHRLRVGERQRGGHEVGEQASPVLRARTPGEGGEQRLEVTLGPAPGPAVGGGRHGEVRWRWGLRGWVIDDLRSDETPAARCSTTVPPGPPEAIPGPYPAHGPRSGVRARRVDRAGAGRRRGGSVLGDGDDELAADVSVAAAGEASATSSSP